MDVNSVNTLQQNIVQMGELLKNVTAQHTGLSEKMMKVNVAEKVSNTGHNLDKLA